MSKATPPPGELRDVNVQMVSLVAKGANRRPFKLFKSADFDEEDDLTHRGIVDAIREGFSDLLKHFGVRKDSAPAPAPVPDPAPNPDEEVVDLNKEELETILKAALAPMESRLEAIEKAKVAPVIEAEPTPAPVATAAPATPAATPDAVAVEKAEDKLLKAVSSLADRLERIEKARGLSNAAVAEHGVKLAKSDEFWGGIFLGEH